MLNCHFLRFRRLDLNSVNYLHRRKKDRYLSMPDYNKSDIDTVVLTLPGWLLVINEKIRAMTTC